MNAGRVATPMLITAEVRTPAMIVRVANRSSTRWPGRNPQPRLEELRVHLADPRVGVANDRKERVGKERGNRRAPGGSEASRWPDPATTKNGTRHEAGHEGHFAASIDPQELTCKYTLAYHASYGHLSRDR